MTRGRNRRHHLLFSLALLSPLVVGVALLIGATQMGPASADVPTVLVTNTASFGPILTTGTGMALYTLDTDHSGQSTCHGSCAAVWPPLNVAAGTVPTGGPGVTGTVASSTQSNGTVQVTYNGAPVYTFVGDTTPGTVTGNNVSGFFVVKVAPVPTTTTTTAPATTSSGSSAPAGDSAPGGTTAAPAPASGPTGSATGAAPPATAAAAGSLAFTGTGPGLVLLGVAGLLMMLLGGLVLLWSPARPAPARTGSPPDARR